MSEGLLLSVAAALWLGAYLIVAKRYFSAATFGVVDVGKRVSMQELAVPPETFVAVMLVTVLVLVAPFAVRRRHAVDVRGDARKLLAVGILVAGGQHLIASAFQTLPASVVSPVVILPAITS